MAGLSAENPLRNAFNKENVARLAASLEVLGFDAAGFCAYVIENFDSLGFGQRATRICEGLELYLPQDFAHAQRMLITALGTELPHQGVASLDGFIVMPQTMYVSRHGKGHVELSLQALYEMTKRFSAEGDLRTFIEVDYEKTMATLQRWCFDPNPHVRRLVSEGTRPRLPLAPRITRFVRDPLPVLALLERLKSDPSLYVRRSVANNINDISKDHPDLVVATLLRWTKDASPDTWWLIRHALRTLLKQGNPAALGLLGLSPPMDIEVKDFTFQGEVSDDASVAIGSRANLLCTLRSNAPHEQRLRLDYIVHFQKAKGKVAPKVFMYSTLRLAPGSTRTIGITHRFVDTSGRKHYPGPHRIDLVVNGQVFPAWHLVLDPT